VGDKNFGSAFLPDKSRSGNANASLPRRNLWDVQIMYHTFSKFPVKYTEYSYPV